MSSSRDPSRQPANAVASKIAEALDKNKEATEQVRAATDELAVAHAVLETKLARGAPEADVAKAVAQTGQVEKRLAKSTDTLDKVNETLEQVLESKG